MEGLVIAAAELRRRVQVHVPDVAYIRCHLVITEKKLMLEPVQLACQGSPVWSPVDIGISPQMSVLVADCPDEWGGEGMAERLEVGDRVRIVAMAFKGKEGTVEGVDLSVLVLLDGYKYSMAFLECECERIEKTNEVI